MVDLLIPSPTLRIDLRTFYFSWKGVFTGGNIYDFNFLNELARQAHIFDPIFPYLYPPFFATFGAPLARLDPITADLVWSLGNVILFSFLLTLTILWARNLFFSEPSKDEDRGLLAILVFGTLSIWLLPFRNNLYMGQVNILVMTFITLAFYLSQKGRNFWAGILLSPAVLIKMTPLLLLPYFLARKKYRAVAGCLLGMGLFILMTLIFGAGAAWVKFLKVLPAFGHGKIIEGLGNPASFTNFSLAGVLSRFLLDQQPTVFFLTVGIIAALLIFLTFLAYRAQNDVQASSLILCFLVLMILASPWCFLHHVLYLLPGAVVTFSCLQYRASGNSRRFLAVLLIVLLGLVSVDFPVFYESFGVIKSLPRVGTSLNFVFLVFLMAYGIFLSRRAES